MADLKIYNDIQSEDTKNIVSFWGGVEGTSFQDIDDFISSIPADDNDINIRLHCNGGEVLEGFAIYDKLRSTGKTISATVEGTCASMATIILLAAQKDKRRAYANAEFLIHEPYMAYATSHGTAEELRKASEEMQRLEDKLTAIYVDRTDASRETIVELMKDGKFIGSEKAMEIGLISTIIEPASAKRKLNPINHNKTEKEMDNETIKVEKSWLQKALSFLGIENESKPLDMTLRTADGAELTVEREEGEPQVGDKASPDGEHTMPDGKTIYVEDGVITEIREPEPEEPATEPDTNEPDAKDEEIESLKAKVEELTKQIETLQGNQKNENEQTALDYVQSVGGLETLKKMASNYVPQQRENTDASPVNKHDEGNNLDAVKERILNRKRTY